MIMMRSEDVTVSSAKLRKLDLPNFPHPVEVTLHGDDDGDYTFRKQIRCYGRPTKNVPGPTRVNHARPAPGPLGPLARGQESPSSASWHRWSFLAGRSKPSGWAKGKVKTGRPMLTCPGSIGPVSHRMLRSNKRSRACGPYFFAKLNSLAVTRICKISRVHMKGQSASQTGLHSAPPSFEWKNCSSCCFEHERAIAECMTFKFASSCHSAFSGGRDRWTFPVLALQMQLHQPPAQENKAE